MSIPAFRNIPNFADIRQRRRLMIWLPAAIAFCPLLIFSIGCTCGSGTRTFSNHADQYDSTSVVADASIPMDTVGQFMGWSGDQAVMRQEEVFSVGETKAIFYYLDVNGTRIPLDLGEWRSHPSSYYIDLPGMNEGLPLVVDFVNRFDSLRVVLDIDADSSSLERVYEALAANETRFPAVKTRLKLRMLGDDDGDSVELWGETRVLSVYSGDSGYQFSFPALETAVLSPDGRLVYFKLVTGDDEEHHIVVIPENAP